MAGPLLFIILSYAIYRRISAQQDLHRSWAAIKDAFTGKSKWAMLLMIGLMLVNWGIETRKWQILVRPVQKVSFFKAYKAVLSGLAFSIFIPNGFGEYMGRLLYMDEGNRLRSVTLSVVGSISQLIVTMVAGTIGVFYLRDHLANAESHFKMVPSFWLTGFVWVNAVITVLLILVYFKLSRLTTLIERIPFIHRHRIFIQNLESFHWKELTRVLLLSTVRFAVFIAQYLLMLHVFNVNIDPVNAVWLTCVVFLSLAIIPTIPMGEAVVRGEISLQLYGLLSANAVGIVATAAVIWTINLMLPALAGSLFILGIKLFRNK